MLTRARFGNNAFFTHPQRKQTLPQRVIYFVRARVQQIFPLQIYARSQLLAQTRRELQRRGATRKIAQQRIQIGVEFWISLGRGVSLLELFERRHQRFGHVAAAEWAVAAPRVGGYRLLGRSAHGFILTLPFVHGFAFEPAINFAGDFAASKKAASRIGSFFPGSDSTPPQTSTA